jgi:hypothetical protein
VPIRYEEREEDGFLVNYPGMSMRNEETGVLQQLDHGQTDRRGERGTAGRLREGAVEDREQA